MKFCGNCGQQNEDDSRFCVNCGSKLQEAEAAPATEKLKKPEAVKKVTKLENINKLKVPPFPKKAGAAAILLLIVILVIFKVVGGRKTAIDLDEYVNIYVSGLDSVGTAYFTIDSDGLFMKLAECIGVDDQDASDPYSLLESLSTGSKKWNKLSDLYDVIYTAFGGSLDKFDELSNGDEIVFAWNNNESQLEEIEKEFNVKFSCEEVKKDVDGLEELKTFDPFANVDVEFSGYSSNGTAEIQRLDNVAGLPYFNYEIDEDSDLSNGDTITVYVSEARSYSDVETFKRDCIAEWGMMPTEVSKEYTVEGLQEIEDYDPFEYINVSFSGTSPSVSISITNNTDFLFLEFSADKSEYLKVGDSVTVSVTGEYGQSPEEICLRNRKRLTTTSKTYTVENVPKYADQLSEIPQEIIDKMDQDTQDRLNARAASTWAEEEKITDISLRGMYFLTLKEGALAYDSWNGVSLYNKLYLVYEVSVDAGGDPFTYYYYSQYKNIVIMEDGTCSLDLSDVAVPDDRVTTDGGYYYYGYADLDTLKYKTVTANIDNFTYEEKFY